MFVRKRSSDSENTSEYRLNVTTSKMVHVMFQRNWCLLT